MESVMMAKRMVALVVGLLVSLVAIPAMAEQVTLTMDELPFQSVDGLSFQGVRFGFTVGGLPDTDAAYDSGNGGQLTFVQDPVIEGTTAGVLTLDFIEPTKVLSFGVALSTFAPLSPGFTVELFDANVASLGVTNVNTTPLISFTEGRFTYSGTAVRRAVVSFNPNPTRFGFDNLTFVRLGRAAVPAVGPAGLLGMLVLLVGVGLMGLRPRHAS